MKNRLTELGGTDSYVLRNIERNRWRLTDEQLKIAHILLDEVADSRRNVAAREAAQHAGYAMAALFPDQCQPPTKRRRLGVID